MIFANFGLKSSFEVMISSDFMFKVIIFAFFVFKVDFKVTIPTQNKDFCQFWLKDGQFS